jgi:hypothetical protein
MQGALILEQKRRLVTLAADDACKALCLVDFRAAQIALSQGHSGSRCSVSRTCRAMGSNVRK